MKNLPKEWQERAMKKKVLKYFWSKGYKTGYKDPYPITEEALINFMIGFGQEQASEMQEAILKAIKNRCVQHESEYSTVEIGIDEVIKLIQNVKPIEK